MGSRFGGVAGIVAMGAGLAIALIVVLTGAGGFDYARATFTFTEPATDYVDEDLVLVREGAVTDVWISEADRANENYGYTPRTPADMLYEGNNTEIELRDDHDVTMCDSFEGGGENCSTFHDVHRISDARADRMAAWPGLADGEYAITSRSVTWEETSTDHATVADGTLTGAGPLAALTVDSDNWVRYWVHGASEPFAVCYDEPNAYDEEGCFTWEKVS